LARGTVADDSDGLLGLSSDGRSPAAGDKLGIEFGTAGLRGPIGEGPGKINRAVVARAAAGLAAWLSTHEAFPSVVIGYDARDQSDAFAQESAEVLAGAGIRTLLLPGPLPTPVLAFAIGHLAASAGVMVTASHNPASDNGVKLYLGDTTLIAAPVDAEIAALMDAVESVTALPRTDQYDRLDRPPRQISAGGTPTIVEAYVTAVAGQEGPARQRGLTVAYTPLHGVGADVFLQVAERAGFTAIHVVPEQTDPDPAFPTVPYPNPEEPGAMDRVLDLGERVGAALVIAHDPDADRCAVAVRAEGGLTVLSGDEVGILLADDLLTRGATGTFASTLVSSDMLGVMAHAHGQPWVQTLTGFKWLGKVPDLAFAYEEALGYCVNPSVSRDKDGISAALAIMRMAARLGESGRTLLDRRDELFVKYGAHLTTQVTVRLHHPGEAATAMQRLRDRPPDSLGGCAIRTIDDLRDGYRGLPPTDGLRFGLEAARVIIRPSGTEPKLKAYIEAHDAAALAAIAEDVVRLIGGEPG
jgi:phosphomannomutase